MKDVFLRIIPPTLVSLLFCYFVYPLNSGIGWMIAVVVVSCLLYAVSAYIFGMTKEEKVVLQSFGKGALAKFRRH